MYVDSFCAACAQIVRRYIADTDAQARERAQGRLDNLRRQYVRALDIWAASEGRPWKFPSLHPEAIDAARLASSGLTLDEFRAICERNRDDPGACAAAAAVAAQKAPEWERVYARACPTAKQRLAAFARLCDMVQAVLEADPAQLPTLYQLTEYTGAQLSRFAVAVPGSRAWAEAEAEAQAIMGKAGAGFGIPI